MLRLFFRKKLNLQHVSEFLPIRRVLDFSNPLNKVSEKLGFQALRDFHVPRDLSS